MALRKFILEEIVTVLFGPLLIVLDGTPSLGQLIALALTMSINVNFVLNLLKLNQSNVLSFSQRL